MKPVTKFGKFETHIDEKHFYYSRNISQLSLIYFHGALLFSVKQKNIFTTFIILFVEIQCIGRMLIAL